MRHRLMASASVQLGTRPVVHIELPRLLMHEVYSTFSQSQLVHYVVTHDVDPSNAVLFQDVEAWEPSELEEFRLPVTEIAVNEGSTKAFENSVVTETIQNSLDAIRSHAHVRAEVRCEVGEDEQFYIYKISDFVGMSPENLLSLMIPFLSSKEVGGQLTTGEMGSGFFNVYRESELVFIDSTLHGRRTLIVDEPVVEHGRVVDLVRRVQVLHIEDSGRRQTDIYVCISKTEGFQLSGFSMFIKNVLCFIPDVPIYLNNELIHVPTVPLLESELFLATHIGKPDMQSYVLTKGVPFSPLYEFIKTSGLFQFPSSEYLASEFQTGILVQLKHNVFTPVQTRARISLLPEVVKPLKQFLLDALYVSLLTKISEGSILNVNYYLPNFTSPAALVQLLPGRSKKVLLEGYGSITQINPFLVYSNYPGTGVSFADMLHSVYVRFGNANMDLEEVQRQFRAECPPLLLKVVMQWLQTKNRLTVSPSLQLKPITPEVLSVDVQERLKVILTAFVSVFWNLGKSLRIVNFKNRVGPKVLFMNEESTVTAYYNDSLHAITINYYYVAKNVSKKALSQFFSVFNSPTLNSFMMLLQSLEQNALWRTFLSNSSDNDLVHELEHARRNNGHNVGRTFDITYTPEMIHSEMLAGGHDNITLKLAPVLPSKTYTFDEGALAVYKLMLANRFFEFLYTTLK